MRRAKALRKCRSARSSARWPDADAPIARSCRYAQKLADDFEITFNDLFTMTNMPIKRFADLLHKQGRLAEYMQLLVDNFNPSTVETTMCRSLVSVRWDGAMCARRRQPEQGARPRRLPHPPHAPAAAAGTTVTLIWRSACLSPSRRQFGT